MRDESALIKKSELWVPGVLLLLAAAFRLAFFSGIYGHDDWAYLFYLRSYNNGQTSELLHSLWGLRFPIWFPIDLLFRCFGVSYWAAFLPGFLCGLATVPMAYLVIRRLGFGTGIATLGGVFLILNPIDWLVSTTLRGDIEMSFYGGALLLLLLGQRQAEGSRKYYWGMATGLVWGLSAITKEWGYVFAWGIFAIALADLISTRRFPWEYTAVAAGFCVVLGADAVLLKHLTGDWLARLHTSVTWYQKAAVRGEYLEDGSVHFRYLLDLFLGLRTELTTADPFPNRFPYYGPYMWLLLPALPLVLIRRGPARPAACFVLGILLWIEFGSMSWREYLPYHKEPRYFSLISVPVAVILAAAGAQIFRAGVSRTGKLLLGGFIGIVLVMVIPAVIVDHQAYVKDRDFIPRLIDWLEKHPTARLWTRASIQNELDLRFGYRFSDPVHNHGGQPGYGSVMDASFWHESRRDGDWILVQPDWRDFSSLFPAVDRRKLKPGPLLSGRYSSAMLYQLQPFAKPEGMYYLSDDDPLRETHSFAPPKWDFSFDSTPIIINGVHYKKGIGVHSRSEITYRIDPQYPVFSAELGLEDSAAGDAGSVVFSVYADETLKYRSPVMRRNSATETIHLDLTGASELKLVVDEAEDGNVCDHAAWGNPLMSREMPAAAAHDASGQ